MSDLIDRMNVYYEIVDYFHEKGYLFEEVNGILENDIEDIIMEAPTVASSEPVRHGRWTDEHKCSACGREAFSEYNVYPVYDVDCDGETSVAVDYSYSLTYHETDFCPMCGAKMDEVSE